LDKQQASNEGAIADSLVSFFILVLARFAESTTPLC